MIIYSGEKLHLPRLSWLVLLIQLPFMATAQDTFSAFVDSAMENNPEVVSVNTQIRQYDVESQIIASVLKSPKMYLSSDLLFAPYLNNNGNLVDTSPSNKAVGYDAGITNGGLYSVLFNLDVPVLKGVEVNHLQLQNDLAKAKLKIRLKEIRAELQQSIGVLYFDALSKQAAVAGNRENTALLNEQLRLVKQLTGKGLYRISDYKLIQLELQSDSVVLNSSVTDLELAVRQLKTACGIQNNEVEKLTVPLIEMTTPVRENSLFIRTYRQDSLAAVSRQQISNDQYRPQINLFANSGLNSTSISSIERRVGMSVGIHLSYTIFDGHQKKLNEQQQMLAIDEASALKELKLKEVKNQVNAYLQTINKAKEELEQQKQIRQQYHDLLNLYHDELQQAQISVIDFIAYLKKYSDVNLSVALKEITLKKLINEYNYWNH